MKIAAAAAAMTGSLLIAGFVTACGTATKGDPAPVPTTSHTTTSMQTPSRTTTPENNPVEILKNTQPCDLLTKDDRQQLGLTGVHRDDSITSRGCAWRYGSASIGVNIRAHQGINTFRLTKAEGGKDVTSITINGRAGKQQPNTNGGCAVTISVTKTSRVDVLVEGLAPKKSCAAARQVAETVEPHLPGKR